MAAALIALAGLVVALTMPYGPATAAHALAVIGSSLVVGLLARRLASGCLVFTFLVTFAL